MIDLFISESFFCKLFQEEKNKSLWKVDNKFRYIERKYKVKQMNLKI